MHLTMKSKDGEHPVESNVDIVFISSHLLVFDSIPYYKGKCISCPQ